MLNIIAVTSLAKQHQATLTFHIARDPEFFQGIQDGRTMLSQDWDLAGEQGWWNVENLLQFVQVELTPAALTTEHQAHPSHGTSSPTLIYNLGVVAGLLGTLADKATSLKDLAPPAQDTFTISHSKCLARMQQGTQLFWQEHGHECYLTDLAMLALYQRYLIPFTFDPIGNTGLLLGWMRAFLGSELPLEFYSGNIDFLAGYHIASQDWHGWRKDELLTDKGFAECLEIEISPKTLATMRQEERWYTETYQVGYIFGLVRGLLSSSDIQIIERPVSTQAA